MLDYVLRLDAFVCQPCLLRFFLSSEMLATTTNVYSASHLLNVTTPTLQIEVPLCVYIPNSADPS